MAYGSINADVIGTSVQGYSLGAGNSSLLKNKIINGAMVISQRYGTTATANTINDYTLDRWSATQYPSTGKIIVQQNAGSVTPPAGFSNYLGVTSQSAYSIGTSDFYMLQQPIEGYNIADLGFGTANAKTVTLSFQVYSSLTGTFGGALRGPQNYPFTYSIPVANTWTPISVTVAGSTSGSWATNNAAGLTVCFGLGVGSTYSATAGSWTNSNIISATGATSVVGTNGATFYITGVQLEVGSSATGFEYVNYQTSLANCQRYYYKIKPSALNLSFSTGGQAYASSNTIAWIPFPVTMRIAPTALEQSGTASDYKVWGASGSGITLTSVPSFNGATNFNVASVDCPVTTGLTAGNASTLLSNSTNAYLGWSAEL